MEQHYNLQGASAYLNTIMALSVLGLVLPNFTTSMSGPRLSSVQEEFLHHHLARSLWMFLVIQTRSIADISWRAGSGTEGGEHAHHLAMRSTGFHVAMLFLYLIAVIVMAEKFAIPLDNLVERLGMPQALGGAVVASLVLAPEALAGSKPQRGINCSDR